MRILALLLAACQTTPYPTAPDPSAYRPVEFEALLERWPYDGVKPGPVCRDWWGRMRVAVTGDTQRYCMRDVDACYQPTMATFVIAHGVDVSKLAWHEACHMLAHCLSIERRDRGESGALVTDRNHRGMCGPGWMPMPSG